MARGIFPQDFFPGRGGDEIALLERHLNEMSSKIRDNVRQIVDEKGKADSILRCMIEGVLVLDPSGKEVAFIPTGESQPDAKEPTGMPSNATFGLGRESKTLYVTVDKSLYRIPLKVEGFHIPFEK